MFKLFGRARGEVAARVEPVISTPAEVAAESASRPVALTSGAPVEQWSEFFGVDFGGVSVTQESAMKFSAVSACVNLIGGTVGTLPVRVMEKADKGGTQEAVDHPANWLLHHEPSDDYSPEVFFEGLICKAVLGGNSYAEIRRTRRGELLDLRPKFRAHVRPFESARTGARAYAVSENGDQYGLSAADTLHFMGTATLDGFEALSPLKAHARAIGIGLSADEYARLFYEQGGRPQGFITYDGKVDAAQAEEIRQYWGRKFSGLSNSHLPAVLSQGGEFKSLMTDPETAQLFQSRAFQVLDIARAFAVPPHLIGESEKSTSWGSGIQAQTMQFYILTLRKLIKRIEGELSRKLLTVDERKRGMQCKINLDALLRADQGARYDGYKVALGGTQAPAFLTVNEVREMEGRARSDDPAADQLYRPVSKSGAPDQSGEDGGGGDPGAPSRWLKKEGGAE